MIITRADSRNTMNTKNVVLNVWTAGRSPNTKLSGIKTRQSTHETDSKLVGGRCSYFACMGGVKPISMPDFRIF